MYKKLTGKEPAEEVLEKAKMIIQEKGLNPVLAIVLVGKNPASEIYVRNKIKKAESIGMKAELHRLPTSINETELLEIVDKLNNDKKISGFIVQMPLPEHINPDKVIESIDPKKDVDGFHPINMGKVFMGIAGEKSLTPATPTGIIKMLDYYKVEIEGKNAVVVGRSNIVGKPVAAMLLNRNATVTTCHSKTKDLEKHTKNADILIVAVGKPGLIKEEMVKEGACVVDVGTTRIGEKLVGDVDFEKVIEKANCSPVPGGVGQLTTSILIKNTVNASF